MGALQGLPQVVQEEGAVRQARQGVVQGHVGELQLHALAVRDVHPVPDEPHHIALRVEDRADPPEEVPLLPGRSGNRLLVLQDPFLLHGPAQILLPPGRQGGVASLAAAVVVVVPPDDPLPELGVPDGGGVHVHVSQLGVEDRDVGLHVVQDLLVEGPLRFYLPGRGLRLCPQPRAVKHQGGQVGELGEGRHLFLRKGIPGILPGQVQHPGHLSLDQDGDAHGVIHPVEPRIRETARPAGVIFHHHGKPGLPHPARKPLPLGDPEGLRAHPPHVPVGHPAPQRVPFH